MAGNWNSGRRPAPTGLKVLRGKLKGPRTDEPTVPAATEDFDKTPGLLKGDLLAGIEWQRVVPVLRAAGLVTVVERSALIAYCQQWSIYQQAYEEVRTKGTTVTRDSGLITVSPYVKIADAALKQCHVLWSMLGLTPSSRSKLAALPQVNVQEQSKWSGLL